MTASLDMFESLDVEDNYTHIGLERDEYRDFLVYTLGIDDRIVDKNLIRGTEPIGLFWLLSELPMTVDERVKTLHLSLEEQKEIRRLATLY